MKCDAEAGPLRGQWNRSFTRGEKHHNRAENVRESAMQIICVSKGTHGGGKDLANSLAEKMGYPCFSREDLIEAATAEGIQVGKLEMAMVRGRGFSQRLALERDHYLAFSRAFICEKALKGSLVYHGRTGHLILPGVRNILRIRAVQDLEYRIRHVMREMALEREKAVRYINEVDEDRGRWVRSMYGVAVEEAINYDFTINLQHLGVENASSALVAAAQLPEFQLTPASLATLKDLYLGAQARMALARDERTFSAAVKVRADNGVVTVGYLPQDAESARHFRSVLEKVPGIRDPRVTMATASMLWIQEEFRAGSETYEKVVEIATKWNASVELLRLAPDAAQPGEVVAEPPRELPDLARREHDGGIEDDEQDSGAEDGGLAATLDELALVGRAGGGRTAFGVRQGLLEAVDRTFPYTLVVVGDAFLSKGHAARIRATRDLRSFLSEQIRAPVVTADELGEQYLFGRRDALWTVVLLAFTVAIFFFVFTNQETVLAFMANTGWYAEAVRGTALARFDWLPKALVSVVLVLFIPVVAFSYGRVASAFMKLIKME
jgi:cytidylate kinase